MTGQQVIHGHAFQGRRLPWARCMVCRQRRSYCAHHFSHRQCVCEPYGCWQRKAS